MELMNTENASSGSAVDIAPERGSYYASDFEKVSSAVAMAMPLRYLLVFHCATQLTQRVPVVWPK